MVKQSVASVAIAWALALLPAVLLAQEGYSPSAENLKAREWFEDARFGLFIHWGTYSVRGEGEWVLQNTRMTLPEYERDLPPFFNPVKFDAAAWVATAKAAGMRYITITSKHHDGFTMYGSKVSDWNIVDRTPYGKDVLKQLADECHKQGIKLFFYYSQLDWHNPDYFPRRRTGLFAGRAETGDFNRYLDYMDAQLKELLTNYGPIAGIWFDGMWDKPDAEWRLGRTYKMIHDLQPQALIGSNHHRKPFPGEDFQEFEKDLPGGTTQSFNEKLEPGDLPLEMCDTINNSWGYNKTDLRKKGAKNLIQLLVKAAGHDANLLLNIGPKPDGTLPEEHVAYLKEMGTWLQKNGETIYGTRGGPIQLRPWGVTTRKGDKVFVHILDWKDAVLTLPRLDRPVKSAAYFISGKPVPFTLEKDALSLRLDPGGFDPIDTIVVLELSR